jgi:hypothetical protein
MERIEVARVRVAGVRASRALGIRHHRHHGRLHLVGRGREGDRVVVALGHLARVDAGYLGRRRVEGLRLGKDLAVETVEAPHDLAADLEMALLVLPHGDEVRSVERDVGRHEHGIAQEPVCAEVLLAELLDLLLVRRHALQPAERRDHPEHHRELRVLRHLRLQEEHRLLGIDARGEEVHDTIHRRARIDEVSAYDVVRAWRSAMKYRQSYASWRSTQFFTAPQ